MSRTPKELRYASTHEWARLEKDGTVTIGITDHAQQALGDVVFVELPEEGAVLMAGDEAGVVESVSAGVLKALEANGRVLLVAPGRDENLELSARNLPTVNVILADSLNVVDLIDADLVLIEQPALARMETVYGGSAKEAHA